MIVLDFDQVLARFMTPRRRPRLAPVLVRALKTVGDAPGNGLIVHSATGIDGFRGLLGRVRAHLIGEHGWEECSVGGRKAVYQLPGRTQRRLECASAAAEACGWRHHLERRRCSLLLRTDALPPDQAGLLRGLGEQLWSPAYETDRLRLDSTPHGPELRATERSTEATIDEAVRRDWPTSTVVHLGLITKASEHPEGRHYAYDRSTTFEVRRSGSLDVACGSQRDIIRLLEEWSERSGTALGSVPEARHKMARTNWP